MPIDISSLRISEAGTSGTATPLKSYAFKPKLAANATDSATKLVLVVAEEGKDIGKASALAKQLAGEGIKDLRAAEDALVNETLGCDRAHVSPLHLSDSSASSVLLVLSSSLASQSSVSVNDPSSSQPVTLDSSKLLSALEATGAKRKQLDFSERGTATTEPIAKPAHQQTKPSKAPVEAQKEDASQLGITVKKRADFPDWYTQVVVKGELADYYTGCYILRPASYFVWSQIQAFFDGEIKKLGVENCYFPMFVSRKVLEREKDHIEGFAPEVAWVTKAGDTELEEHIAIRPTSETVMYPYYAKWIRSHRDLPLKLNQWNSVVRWEFKQPQPFMRTREFLWQEGHTAFLRKEEADKEVLDILDLYRRVYEDLLAVPVIPGVKSEKEKFAGGLYTTTVEGFISASGRGIQGGTSHCLGQNFSKMFNVVVEDPDKPAGDGGEAGKLHVWQNSWGLSTRTIGVMIMVHGDDKGLVIPPRVAQTQVVVIPTGISAKTTPEEKQKIESEVDRVASELRSAGIRVKTDLRTGYTPGFKFSDWELRGVPLRLEIGPKDLANKSVLSVRRDNGAKAPLSLDSLSSELPKLLDTIHEDMFSKAKSDYESHIKVVREWKDFTAELNQGNVCVIPWCEVEKCEDSIKVKSAKESAEQVTDERAPSAGAKSLCIPFDQHRFGALGQDAKCTGCGEPAKRWTLFGRSY